MGAIAKWRRTPDGAYPGKYFITPSISDLADINSTPAGMIGAERELGAVSLRCRTAENGARDGTRTRGLRRDRAAL